MLNRIARTWLLLGFAGLVLYVAFYAALGVDTPFKDKVFAILAVVSFTLTISILLALDDDQQPIEENLENMTFAGLGYVLLVRRKPLVAVLVLTLAAIGLAVYYLSKSMGVTLEAEGSSLPIKLPGQTIHYIPIHSQLGWQNTGIELKAEQKVKYSIAGAVSPGYLQDIDIRSAQLRGYKLALHDDESPEPRWPFTGPEGYEQDQYYYLGKRDQEDCDEEPPNRVALETRVQQLQVQLHQISRTLSRLASPAAVYRGGSPGIKGTPGVMNLKRLLRNYAKRKRSLQRVTGKR
jgi:hypothetical protein